MKKLIFIFIILLISIINFIPVKKNLYTNNSLNQDEIPLEYPWDYTKYYLYPVTYDKHNNGTYGAVDFYYFVDKNMSNQCIENSDSRSKSTGNIEVLSANNGRVYINLVLWSKPTDNKNEVNWEKIYFNNGELTGDIPRGSFQFDKNNNKYYIDMQIYVENNELRTYYVHLKIDDRYFSEKVKKDLKEEINHFYKKLKFRNDKDYKQIDTEKDIKVGELLGYIDKKGNAASPHLHFEVYKNGFIDLKKNNVNFRGEKIFDENFFVRKLIYIISINQCLVLLLYQIISQ